MANASLFVTARNSSSSSKSAHDHGAATGTVEDDADDEGDADVEGDAEVDGSVANAVDDRVVEVVVDGLGAVGIDMRRAARRARHRRRHG